MVSYESIAASTASADASEIIIPVFDNGSVNDYAEYELTYYVNDINTANTQVLMTYGGNASEKSVYTYGVGRISEEKVQEDETGEYLYDGRGSVVQTAVAGEIELSITYDPFGEITGGVDDNFIGYAYNGEESNQVTGLQYLRARYYDSELGSFITIDSYLGSLTDVLSQNRYTYAENNPVNNIDPSGHSSQNVNGIANYSHDTWLNEMRNYMTSAAMYAGQIEAQNTVISDALDHAMSLDFKLFEGISIISQADMNCCINDAVSKAGKVSLNYGCSVPAVPNVAIAKLENTLETARQNANEQISVIKESKRIKYNAYQNSLYDMELLKKEAEEAQKEIAEDFLDEVFSSDFEQEKFIGWTDSEILEFFDKIVKNMNIMLPDVSLSDKLIQMPVATDTVIYYEISTNAEKKGVSTVTMNSVFEDQRAVFDNFSVSTKIDNISYEFDTDGAAYIKASGEFGISTGELIVGFNIYDRTVTAEYEVSTFFQNDVYFTSKVGLKKTNSLPPENPIQIEVEPEIEIEEEYESIRDNSFNIDWKAVGLGVVTGVAMTGGIMLFFYTGIPAFAFI